MANMNDLIKVLANMTNTDVTHFSITTQENTQIALSDVVSAAAGDVVNLYSVDVQRGTVKVKTLNCNLKGVNAAVLASEVSRYWYYLQRANLSDLRNLVDVLDENNTVRGELSDDNALRYDVLLSRLKDAYTVFKAAGADVVGISDAAKNIVRALAGVPVASYDTAVKSAVDAVMDAFKVVFDARSKDVSSADGKKAFESKIADLKCALFPAGGVVTGVHHKCNAAMRELVYMAMYTRSKTDKNGFVKAVWAKSSLIVADVVLQVVGAMQDKPTEDKPTEDKKKNK